MDMNADPRVLAIPYVKISRASQYQANLFIGVQMFGIENLELQAKNKNKIVQKDCSYLLLAFIIQTFSS